jgi:hypothetical protein
MRDTERWQKIAIAVASVVVLALIGVLVFRDDSPPTKLSAGTKRTTTSSTETTIDEETTTSFSDLGTSTTAGAAVSTTRPTSKTTTTRRSTGASGAATTAAPTTATIKAPAPGTYTYTEDASGDGGNTHNEYSLVITAGPNDGNGVRRNASYAGGAADEQSWGAEKVLSLRRADPNGCTWQPGRTLYLTKLASGATWAIDSTCRVDTVQYPQTTHEQTQYSVTRREADGTWVIHFKSLIELIEDNQPDVQKLYDGEGDIWLDPARGLQVRKLETAKTVDLPNGRTIDTRLVG